MVTVHLHSLDATHATPSMIKSPLLFLDFFHLVSNGHFQGQIWRFCNLIFNIFISECLVLTILATVSFTTAIYAIQWFIASEDTWAGCWFGTSTSSRSNDSIEQTEWILPPRRVRQEAIEKRNNYYDDCWNDYAGQQTLPARV